MTTWLESARQQCLTTLLDNLRQALGECVDPQQVAEIHLFGSWARGDFDGYSDVDLLVILKPGIDPAVVNLDDLENRLGRPLDLLFIDMPGYQRALDRQLPFFLVLEKEKRLIWTRMETV